MNANLHRGKLTQLLAYRKRDGSIRIRLKSSGGTHLATGTAAANAADYSASREKVGVTNSVWPTSGLVLSASPFRLFRGWVGNLSRKEVDPAAVADEDYANVLARAAADTTIFSAS